MTAIHPRSSGRGFLACNPLTGKQGADSANHNYDGLVGIHWTGTIEESFATGNVETDGRAGSLVGRVSQQNQDATTAKITNSYATGNVVSRNDAAGGIVGSVHNGYSLRVNRSFATGQVAGQNTGGLVGEIGSGGNVSLANSYWDNETTNQSTAVGDGSARSTTTTGFSTSNVTGTSAADNMALDFDEIWQTVSNDYPKLRWEE